MRFVALFSYGPRWRPGRSVYQQGQAMSDHLATMRQRFDEGSLLLGGPFEREGGIAVLECPARAAAIALLDIDPAVVAGVLDYELFELTAFFDAFDPCGPVRTEATVAELDAARRRVRAPADIEVTARR